MCGIGSITTSKTASPSVLARLDHAASTLLRELDHRGGDACGILTIRADGRCHTIKAPCDADTFNKGRGRIPEGTRAIAVHTRFATSGEPCWNRNNHPVTAGKALVLHNGVIWDYRNPNTTPHPEPEVDTYLLAKAAATTSDRLTHESAQQHAERAALAMAQEEGSAAVLLAYRGHPFLASIALNGSPLHHAKHKGIRVTASTHDAVRKTFDALGITLPTIPYSYTKTIKKAKRGKPARTQLIHSTRSAITYANEGDVITWNAGQHTNGHIELPQHYAPLKPWQHNGISETGSYLPAHDDQGAWHDNRISDIAAKMLDANTFRCELCDDATITKLTPAYGLLCCDACLTSMDADPLTKEHKNA